METTHEKAEKLFRRIGPLKVTDEEIKKLTGVTTAQEINIVRFVLVDKSNNLYSETLP